MKSAIIAAIVAALVSSGGTYAAVQVNGHSIRPHSIPLNRLAGSLLTRASTGYVDIPAGQAGAATATCPSGSQAFAGGFRINPGVNYTGQLVPLASWPTLNETGWTFSLWNRSNSLARIQTYATCEVVTGPLTAGLR
jgi:hypothetical protein